MGPADVRARTWAGVRVNRKPPMIAGPSLPATTTFELLRIEPSIYAASATTGGVVSEKLSPDALTSIVAGWSICAPTRGCADEADCGGLLPLVAAIGSANAATTLEVDS